MVGVGEGVEGEELIDDDLLTDELADTKQVVIGDAQQPGDGVENVAEDELEGELGVDHAPVAGPPAEEAVNEPHERDDAQQRGDDHAGDLQAEPRAVGERVQRVRRLVLLVVGHHHVARRERLLGLRVPHLRDGEGRRDRHDAGRDEGLRVQAHLDVGDEHGTGNGGETAGHDLVDLGLGEMRDERSDQHGRLALADEGRGGGDDSLGTGYAEGPEEEDGELADEPLDEADVVAERHESDEEDDGRNNAGEEPGKVGDGVVRQEHHTLVGEPQERAREERDEVENVVAGLGSQDENSDDKLAEHAADNRMPGDHPPVSRSQGHKRDHDYQSEKCLRATGASVLAVLRRNHGSDQEYCDGDDSGERLVEFTGDHLVDPEAGMFPDEFHRHHNILRRYVEGDDTKRDSEP